ncbi:MAG: hypothetical protein KC492_35200, partial [Myxococcales bacterium]|nr:hypothetical protein [Myxococcales bacterium]
MARTPLAAAFPRIHRVSGYRGLGCGALTLFGLCLALPAAAQSIGGEVEHHVDQGLKSKQRSSPPKKKKKTKARTSKKAPPRRTPEQRGYWSGDPNAATQPKAPETKYPIRILGGGLRIDPGIGGAYRGWRPQGYPALDVSTQNYYTWSVDVGVGFFGWVTL